MRASDTAAAAKRSVRSDTVVRIGMRLLVTYIACLSTAANAPTAPSREQVFQRLVGHEWSMYPEGRLPEAGFADILLFRYHADGKYERRKSSDIGDGVAFGRWNLVFSTVGAWMIVTDEGKREPVTLERDGSVAVGSQKLYPVSTVKIPLSARAEALPVVDVPALLTPLAGELTAHPWKRANDLDLDRMPTSVEFFEDWSCAAIYRAGERRVRGTWYVTTRELVAYTKNETGKWEAFISTPLRVGRLPQEGALWIGHDLYVPEPAVPEKGVLLGFSKPPPEAPFLVVRYQRPITKGRVTRFEVTLRNNVGTPLVLQRFSLTQTFVRRYRTPSQQVATVPEIAGKDLGRRVLEPAQEHTFAVDALFPRTGKQRFYVNVLALRATKTWDFSSSAHIVEVR